ncbi:MAG: CBS domain-containing protein [Gemmatimonadota bacterium]
MTAATDTKAGRGEAAEGSVTPIRTIPIGDTTSAALKVMDEAGLDYLPVVDHSGSLAGVVLRGGVERGCRGMAHDPERCLVLNHLKRNVRRWRVGDELDEAARSSLRGPIIAVDGKGAPVGVLEIDG